MISEQHNPSQLSINSVKTIPIPFEVQNLTIAVAQLEGPLPNGKQVMASPHSDKDTWQWRGSEEVKRRRKKVFRVLDYIDKTHAHTNMVVFPEYAIPIMDRTTEWLPLIQAHSNQTGRILIIGGDNIATPDLPGIINTGIVIIPNQQPIWMTKHTLSPYENDLVDSAEKAPVPVLIWGDREYPFRIALYGCLDFLSWPLAIPRDHPGPILNIVSMCSPEYDLFRVYADVNLMGPESRLTILCNAIGNAACGRSSLFARIPGQKYLEPVFELPTHQEALALFTIECQYFLDPKQTARLPKMNVITHRVFALSNGEDRLEVDLLETEFDDDRSHTRAVINPAIFDYLNKTMRVVFVKVHGYGAMSKKDIEKYGFECYSVLGQCDLIITHLASKPVDAVFDITQCINVVHDGRVIDEKEATAPDIVDKYQMFEVRRFHKVLGVPLTPEKMRAFDENRPTETDIRNIMALGANWDSPNHSKVRNEYLKRGWLLNSTTTQPGRIDTIMTIGVTSLRSDTAADDFEENILPLLIDDSRITTVLGGTGHRIDADYVLRLACDVKELFQLIETIHSTASKKRLFIATRTYVVVKRWADLKIEAGLLETTLTSQEKRYLNRVIIPRLPPEVDKREFPRQPPAVLKRIIEDSQQLLADVDRTRQGDLDEKEERKTEALKNMLIAGIVGDRVEAFVPAHTALQNQTEVIVNSLVRVISEKEFITHRPQLRVRDGATLNRLSYTERINLARYLAKISKIDSRWNDPLNLLFDTTITVRNAFAHQDLERISRADVLGALHAYCEFIVISRELQFVD